MFTIGESYTREQIHTTVGGSKRICLPYKNQSVTCACLTREMNPDAPRIILAGGGSNVERSLTWLTEQADGIPVFIKESVNNWIYQGRFRVKKCVANKKKIRKKYQLAGRTDVQMALEMTECG